MSRIYLATFMLFVSAVALADAQVVDLSQANDTDVVTLAADPNNTTNPAAVEAAPPLSDSERLTRVEQQMANITQMNLSARLDNMQQQIQQLQGQLEVATHNLQSLTDQQKKFYQDLDQRITQLNKSGAAVAAAASAISDADTSPNSSAVKEQDIYQNAFKFLTQKKYDQAVTGFQNYLKNYAQGQFAANAHYWLGEVYFLQNKADLATQEFQTIIKDYSKDTKVPDAKLKLAFIHGNNGEKTKSKQELKAIIKEYPHTPAAQLAAMRLKAQS